MRELSPAQLTAAFKASRRERTIRDQRALMIAGAAMAGGEAYRKVCAVFERELQQLDNGPATAEQIENELPLSQEDFLKLMKEK